MALQNSWILSLLLVILFAIIPLILTWGYLSDIISWIIPSGKKEHRHEGGSFGSDRHFWAQMGNTSPPPAVITTLEKSKIPESARRKPLEMDQMRSSTCAAVAGTPLPVLDKKSFYKLPQWEFEHDYILDSPPRNTVSAYVCMTEDYKKYFNYYYEKKKTEVVFYICHDYILEKDT